VKGITLTEPWAIVSVHAPLTRLLPFKTWETRDKGFPLKESMLPLRVVMHAGKGDAGMRSSIIDAERHRFRNPYAWCLESLGYSTRDPWYKKWDGDYEVAPDGSKRIMVPMASAVGFVTFDHVMSTDAFMDANARTPKDHDAVNFVLGNYQPGRICMRMTDAVKFPQPIPCKGALGLWTVPDDVLAAIEAQGVAL
jgi:hypothetical protein